MDDKIISILAVVVYRVIFLDQAEGQDVGYSLGVIPAETLEDPYHKNVPLPSIPDYRAREETT